VNPADTSRRHVVRLIDGTRLLGRITRLTADSVFIELPHSAVAAARSAVRDVREIDASRLRDGVYWPANPRGARLLLSPTALRLGQGTTLYSNVWLLAHSLDIGLTDRIQVGGGFTFVPGLELRENIAWLQAQLQVLSAGRLSVAAGAFHGGVLDSPRYDENDPHRGGLLYGVTTWGSAENSVTLGLAWPYDEQSIARRPLTMIGGQLRVTSRLALVAENWFAWSRNWINSPRPRESTLLYGVRLVGERWSVDAALMSVRNVAGWGPWLGVGFRP
jgi:hypothetical protein